MPRCISPSPTSVGSSESRSVKSHDSAADLQSEGKLNVEEYVERGYIQFLKPDTKYAFGKGQLTMSAHPQKHHDIVNYALVFEEEGERLLYSTDLDSLEPTDVVSVLMSDDATGDFVQADAKLIEMLECDPRIDQHMSANEDTVT